MRVLIAEESENLGRLWAQYLERAGLVVDLKVSQAEVVKALQLNSYEALIMNLDFPEDSILGLTDLATYRNPNIAIVVVTNKSFFSEGSIFDLIPNACGYFNSCVDPKDLTEIVKHYAA